jgi:hypothetical protein
LKPEDVESFPVHDIRLAGSERRPQDF